MPALKRTGSAVSESGLVSARPLHNTPNALTLLLKPPPSKFGRSHGPLEEEEDDIFFEGQPLFPLASAVPSSDANLVSSTAKNAKGKAKAVDVEDVVPKNDKVETKAADVEDVVPKNDNGKAKAADPSDAQTRRDEKNAAQQAARRREAAENPQLAILQRKESGWAHSPLVAEFWITCFVILMKRELAVQNAVATHTDDLQAVQAAVAAHCSAESHSPISSTAPVWAAFPPRIVAFLAAAARNPTTLVIDSWIADGTLVLSDPDDDPPTSACANYVRRIKVGKKVIGCLTKYLSAYPADAANAVLQILLLGGTLDDVQAEFSEAMAEFGLDGAVQSFVAAIERHKVVAALAATRRAGKSTTLPYVGITHAVAPGKRGWDDLDAGANVRIVNFLEANGGLEWETYHLPELDTPISSPMDVRTNPDISHKERIMRAVFGAVAMNSAHGGVQPIFIPSEALAQLQQRVLSMTPVHPFPLGQDRDPQLEARIQSCIDDEVRLLGPMHPIKIVDEALDAVKTNIASVLRLSKGRVLTLHVAKDITFEGMSGKCVGYWDGHVGPGPQTDRYFRRMLHPQIPAADNLPVDVIARYIGPYVDFWRVIFWHWLYWLHVLLLARLLTIIRPLVITSQSNPVAAMIHSGDLATCWSFLPEEVLEQFLAGNSPVGLEKFFPADVRYRRYLGGEFNALLGSITVVRSGRHPSNLSLYVAGGDYGRHKYEPSLAWIRCIVDLYVQLVDYVVLQTTAAHLDRDDPVNWDDSSEVKRWLETVKAAAETKLVETGVTAALEEAKKTARVAEEATGFLRSMLASKRAHEAWLASTGDVVYKRREGIKAAPSGELRRNQLDLYLRQALELDSFDLPPDPNHLGSYPHPILSDSFPTWFLGLKDGVDIVYSANAEGHTKESYDLVQAKRDNFAEWRRTNPVIVDVAAIDRKNLLEAVAARKDGNVYTVSELLQCWRYGLCDICGSFVLGRHNDLTSTEFPTLERILYAHDILNAPEISFGNKQEVLTKLELVAVSVASILTSQRAALRKVLCADDFAALSVVNSAANVYVPKARLKDAEFLLTLAVDVVLANHSTCPAEFLPTHPEGRVAWRKAESKKLTNWFQAAPREQMFIVVCAGPADKKVAKSTPSFFLSTAVTERVRKAPDSRKKSGASEKAEGEGKYRVGGGGRECSACDGAKSCNGRKYHPVATLLDLPPHYARHIWLSSRLGLDRAEPRVTKKAKERRIAGS
ncbi:hypothetical protein DFH09DRAFT_1410440 [Mycena vulgaris]|nr:hypothetical protein DFH09DRAFT_1410440 [Mycena vulgaris]